jgi:deoxyhypusine synthase
MKATRQKAKSKIWENELRRPMEVFHLANSRSIKQLLCRMRHSAFQGRNLGEAFEIWIEMIESPSYICLGYAGSLSSAGLWPLVNWLLEHGYVDMLVSTSANVTEDLLEQRGSRFHSIKPSRVDDGKLWEAGYYRFYDHLIEMKKYDEMEVFVGKFFEYLSDATPRKSSMTGVLFMYEFGKWLNAKRLGNSIAATCYRNLVPLFVPAMPDGPLGEGYRSAARKGPVLDFFADYQVAVQLMNRFMTPDQGTSAIFLGGGVPKDFIQITATSVCALRGNGDACPHAAAIQITTDNEVFGGLGGASVATEAVSWGKEAANGRNAMLHADLTIALPLLCQGLLEHFGPKHKRGLRRFKRQQFEAVLECN